MVQNEYILNIDIKRKQTAIVPTFVQHDSASIVFRLFDNGVPMTLTPFNRAEVSHVRSDGQLVIGVASFETHQGKDQVRYEYLGNEMSVTGFTQTQLVLYADDRRISVQPFKVHIVSDITNAIGSSQEFGILQQLIATVEALETQMRASEDARESNERARMSNENQRITNENNRANAENLRDSNENQRQVNEQIRIGNENQRIANEQDRQDTIEEIERSFGEFVNRGLYSGATQYHVNNIVSYKGSSYMNIRDSLGILPTDSTHWKLLSEKGEHGASLSYVGVYSSTQAYIRDELVSFNGRLYACMSDNTGQDINDTDYWELFLSSSVIDIQEEEFILAQNQRIINVNGSFIPNANVVSLYVGGVKQPHTAYEEIDSTSIRLLENYPTGVKITVEYIQFINVDLHANELQRIQNEQERIVAEGNRIHKGEYSPTDAYLKGNEVFFEGSTWRCLQDCINEEPQENQFWTMVAHKGDKGDEGILKSPTAPTDIITDRVWLDTSDDILKIQNADGTFRDMMLRGKLIILEETHIAPSDNSSLFTITNAFHNTNDKMYVFYEGIKLNEGEHYQITSNSSTVELLDWGIDSGEIIEFIIVKDFVHVDTVVNGQQLLDGTIEKVKLEQPLQDEIDNKIDSSEKGIASGVALLNANGEVLDANGNVVNGKVTSVNGSVGDVTITIPTELSQLNEDINHRLVTNLEKSVWNAKYSKPTSGIPQSDLSTDVQSKIDSINDKYEKPSDGIPLTDLSQDVRDSINNISNIDVNIERKLDSFVASNGQKNFTLTKSYELGKNRLDVTIDGIVQYTPDNYTEASTNSIRFSEGLYTGAKVRVVIKNK